MSWYTQRTISGFAIQWRLAEGKYVTAMPNQYGKIKWASYPSKEDGFGIRTDLLAALNNAAGSLGKIKRSHRFDAARRDVCDAICDKLTERGVTPYEVTK